MAQRFEQAVVRILYATSQKKGFSQADMGRMAFEGESAPDRKVRLLFDIKRPRSLKVSEMYAWARGVGLDPIRVVSRALDIVEGSGEMPEIDISNRPGRKQGHKSLKVGA